MIWFWLLLIIFWKPVYWGIQYGVRKYKKDNESAKSYLEAITQWFIALWTLIYPGGRK